MPKPKIVFVCNICGKIYIGENAFESFKKARQCEARGVPPFAYSVGFQFNLSLMGLSTGSTYLPVKIVSRGVVFDKELWRHVPRAHCKTLTIFL